MNFHTAAHIIHTEYRGIPACSAGSHSFTRSPRTWPFKRSHTHIQCQHEISAVLVGSFYLNSLYGCYNSVSVPAVCAQPAPPAPLPNPASIPSSLSLSLLLLLCLSSPVCIQHIRPGCLWSRTHPPHSTCWCPPRGSPWPSPPHPWKDLPQSLREQQRVKMTRQSKHRQHKLLFRPGTSLMCRVLSNDAHNEKSI